MASNLHQRSHYLDVHQQVLFLQELLAELKGQTAAAADHQARVLDLTEVNRKLDIANGQLHDVNGELLECKRQLEEGNKDLRFQLEGLRSALTDAFKEHEAAQSSFGRQLAQQAEEHSQVVMQLTDTIKQLERQQECIISDRSTQLGEANVKLVDTNKQREDQIAVLAREVNQAQQDLLAHQAHQSQRAQQTAHDAGKLSELQTRNSQLEGEHAH